MTTCRPCENLPEGWVKYDPADHPRPRVALTRPNGPPNEPRPGSPGCRNRPVRIFGFVSGKRAEHNANEARRAEAQQTAIELHNAVAITARTEDAKAVTRAARTEAVFNGITRGVPPMRNTTCLLMIFAISTLTACASGGTPIPGLMLPRHRRRWRRARRPLERQADGSAEQSHRGGEAVSPVPGPTPGADQLDGVQLMHGADARNQIRHRRPDRCAQDARLPADAHALGNLPALHAHGHRAVGRHRRAAAPARGRGRAPVAAFTPLSQYADIGLRRRAPTPRARRRSRSSPLSGKCSACRSATTCSIWCASA